MRILWKFAVLTLGGGLLLSTPSMAFAQEVKRIEIKASYNNGFGYDKTVQTRIVRKNTDYVFCTSINKNSCAIPIIKEAVDHLVQAVALPPLEKLDVTRLGLTENKLKDNADKAFETKREGLKGRWLIERCEPELCSGPVYRETFLRNYTDLKQAQRWFQYYFNSFWTDDYPFFRIKLIFENGGTETIESGDQHQLMLPWQVTRNGKVFKTYAPEIPRALQLVLPDIKLKKWPDKKEAEELEPQVYNYHRIEMDPYEFWLEELLVFPVRKDMHVHKLRTIFGEKMKFIESRFDIYDLNLDAAFSWNGIWIRKETRLPLQLKFRIDKYIDFPKEKKNLIELYPIVERSDKSMQVIANTPWLNAWWEREKGGIVRFQINANIWNTKVSDVQNILKNFESNGFKLFVQQWTPKHHNLASMTVVHSLKYGRYVDQFSEFLVLPNGDMILWRTNMDNVYKWNRAQYGDLSKNKRYQESYHSAKINYLVRINSNGKMTIQKPDS